MEAETLKDKVPPHNAEAEQATLGAILLDWDAMSNVVTKIKPDKSLNYPKFWLKNIIHKFLKLLTNW